MHCQPRGGALGRQQRLGPLNAKHAMDRAVELAHQFGIGMVALGNNNHWMRGGTYGWQAADAGCIGICWSNTCPNMPAWGAKDNHIGNNPLILAVPRSNGEHIMVDCALSQFSYGKLETMRLAGKQLPVVGGYDADGSLTTDPAAIEETRRMIPIGYWKGSGLSILLDMIGTILTGANSVATIGTFGDEAGLTQIMIAIDPAKFQSADLTDAVIDAIAADVASSEPAEPGREVRCPGMGEHRSRKENMELGIPIAEEKWAEVLAMMIVSSGVSPADRDTLFLYLWFSANIRPAGTRYHVLAFRIAARSSGTVGSGTVQIHRAGRSFVCRQAAGQQGRRHTGQYILLPPPGQGLGFR